MAVSSNDLQDILELLGSNRPEVSRQASALLKALSADVSALKAAASSHELVLSRLLAAAGSADLQTSEDALTGLVNLAQDEELRGELLGQQAAPQCLAWLRQERGSTHAELAVMLLSNLTVSDEGAKQLTAEADWLLLVERARRVPEEAAGCDAYAHVASILTNAAREAAARRSLLAQSTGFPALVAAQLRSTSLVRRRGFSAALRNVLLKAEEDGTLADAVADDASYSQILERLCGGEAGKDVDGEVRATLAEAVWTLAQTNEGIDLLWRVGAPEKLRKGYEDEEDEKACAAMEATAEVFLSAA